MEDYKKMEDYKQMEDYKKMNIVFNNKTLFRYFTHIPKEWALKESGIRDHRVKAE